VTNAIVNGDEMIINPQITDWASVEKKIAYVTVANMYDLSDNRQESPITWTAYITKNPLKWFVEGYDNNMSLVLNEKKTDTYQLVIANVGGNIQNFTLSAPNWLKLQSRAGTIAPNSQVKINFTVDTTLSAGNYFDQIKLSSKYNFIEKIQLNLRVLKAEPNWDFNPLNFEENMNVISKVRIDGKLSSDTYDKVIAFYMDSVRGIAPIEYDRDLDEYYALLTIYGNADAAGLPINFKIWDASDGRLKSALLNDSATIMFQPNLNIGNYSQPVLFTNSGNETQILSMNKGWTWLSFYLNDPNFSQLNTFFKTAKLTKGDVIKTSSPALFDVYNVSPIAGQTGWAGTISLNGGLSSAKMYKVKLEVPQKLMTTGLPVNLITQTFLLDTTWMGLPYSANRNLPLNEALANLDAQNGDIIKSQSQFAIYDRNSRLWKGNLTNMFAGEGYMIKTAKKQTFSYPVYANTNAVSSLVGSTEVNATIKSNSVSSQTLVSEFTFDGTKPSPSYITDEVIEPVKLTTELSKYGETMNIVASIPKEFDKVVFYNTSTNQIIGQSQDVMIDNNKYVFATIYGDSIINMKAELVNKDTKVTATNTIVFVPNAVIGTIKNPYNIEYIKPNTTEVNAYPNPFVNDLTLEFNSTIQGIAYISIYNEQTQLVDSKQINVIKGMNRYIYHANQSNLGNYLIFKVDVGDQHFTKLVFKL
jgi:hypothetical protein